MNYQQLSALPAEAYLNPELFRTEFDNLPTHKQSHYRDKKYYKGLEIGKEYSLIVINNKSIWSAHDPWDGRSSYCESWEGIGYHACTADLLRGFLDSPAKIIIHRFGKKSTLIKKASKK